MEKTSSVLLFCLLILLVSCAKELNYDLSSDEKLVLSTIIEPDQTLKFYIGTTSDFFEKTNNKRDSIYHLRVNKVIKEESNTIPILNTEVHEGLFDTKKFIGMGGTYNFILHNDLGDSVLATESIPKITFIDKLAIQFPVGLDDDNNPYGTLYLTFQDDSTQKNFYEIPLIPHSRTPVTDPVVLNEGDLPYQPSTYFFSDEMFNGKKVTISINLNFNTRYDSQYDKYYLVKPFKITLRSVSENYYKYKKYLTRHLYNQQFQGDFWDVIYMSEPQNMYSNVVGGFGVVASFNEHSAWVYNLEE